MAKITEHLESPFLDEEIRGVEPKPEEESAFDDSETTVLEEGLDEDEVALDEELAFEDEDEFESDTVEELDESEYDVSEECEDEFEEGEEPEEMELDYSSEQWQSEEKLTEQEGAQLGQHIQIVNAKNEPLLDGKYAIHQGKVSHRGNLDKGRASFGKIDPSKAFVFELLDRVCAIRVGALFDPDDATIEYGGTWFDWTLVRDNKNPAQAFWPHYQKEMDNPGARTVDCFMQHEHITRRPIRIAKPFLKQLAKVRIRATPVRIRTGPFVRYADHQCAVIWLETVTPALVRVRHKKASGGGEAAHHASTVRVGGRHFAAVELDGLEKDTFYDYTLELVPLPGSGKIPVTSPDVKNAFPKLTTQVTKSMEAQLTAVSLNKSAWLTFRTLRPEYKRLRFATGSCRWYPSDKDRTKKETWGPDMLEGLGTWLRSNANKKDSWPHFLFFGGDQIYADEIGIDHGEKLIHGRFASRIPGPTDPAGTLRTKLIDGAWAGRFAHRFRKYEDPGDKQIKTVKAGLKKLDDIHERYPDIKGIVRDYPDHDPVERLEWRYRLFKGKRGSAKLEADDERRLRESIAHLPVIKTLEISTEPLRPVLAHWEEASREASLQRNPMRRRFLCHNFLLWSIPDFETQLANVAESHGMPTIRRDDTRGHPAAEAGRHAADFAEYAYLYERTWTTSPNVRALLAHVPTFLMFDDHEVTDDWNFDLSWVRMLHNRKDAFLLWPKTLTDALSAYWVYQGWCNKAPSQWRDDPRARILVDAQKAGIDALPQLRKCIQRACFTPAPPPGNLKKPDPKATYQSGMNLEWHYKLPFDPPFLVPDCRSRRFIAEADDQWRKVEQDSPTKAPRSQTIDDKQLEWLRKILLAWKGGPAVFIAPSTPLLMQRKVMSIMQTPEIAAQAGVRGVDLAGLGAALFDSTAIAPDVPDSLLKIFRRSSDLEHMIRDRSWRDLWGLFAAMRKNNSPVKTVVLVSGDVHHSYAMTANLPGHGRPTPELLQITSSGLQTMIRWEFKTGAGEALGSLPFDVGQYRLVPGFVRKGGTGVPDLILYENTVALVDVNMGAEVDVVVTYLAGKDKHIYRYTSGPAYMKGSQSAVGALRQQSPI